jgi:pimeloyl-ACP methyl ester carboxylesterase
LLADSLESGNGFGPLIVLLTPTGQPAYTQEAIDMGSQKIFGTNDPLAIAAVARGIGELSNVTAAEFHSNSIPLLYIVGELDPLKADVERALGVVSHARSIIIPGADHLTAVVHPMLLESIQAFFAESAAD